MTWPRPALLTGLVLAAACTDYKLVGPGSEAPVTLPEIVVDPESVDFGSLEVGCYGAAEVRIENIGDAVLVVDSVGWSTDGAIWGEPDAMELDPGASATVPAFFAPEAAGEATATIQIASNDPERPLVEVPLAGLAEDPLAVDRFVQPDSDIDVLWIVDNSGSMGEEQARVIDDIAAFMGWFLTLELDFHVGVITTDIVTETMAGRLQGDPTFVSPDTADPLAVLATALAVGTEDQGDESGLAALRLALSEPLLSEHNAGFYRPEAYLEVVILSDEPEQSGLPSSDYIDFLEELKTDVGLVHVSAIVGDRKAGCSTKCDGVASTAQPGDAYLDVAEAFDGATASICTCDLREDLDRIGMDATLVFRSYELTTLPTESDSFVIAIDGVPLSEGWTYDAEANRIILDTPPAAGAEVTVSYPRAPECG